MRNRVLVLAADVTPLYDPERYRALYRSVSALRREKTDRLVRLTDRCLSLGAEALLMAGCREFGIDYASAQTALSERSRPYFRDCPVSFSLSHSGERAMCILSDYPAGCDVEKTGRADLRVARRFFTEAEFLEIERGETPDEREARFYRIWTLKESFMKCTGLGFHLPMDRFSVSADGEEASVSYPQEPADWRLRCHREPDGYQYAWCLKVPPGDPGPEAQTLTRLSLES